METILETLIDNSKKIESNFSLKKFSHCLLEMPTGTGKTLCILSSILAYMETYKN